MRVPFMPVRGACARCGRAVTGPADAAFLCEDCRGPHAPVFDRAATAVRFEGDARRMLLDFKFNRRLYLRADLVDWMEAAALARLELSAVDAVLPMPLTRLHRWERGYNQCDCLADDFARRIDRRCDGGVLRRCGSPRRQSTLSADARRENVKGTVQVRHPERVRGRTLLVVDDIMTTGATLSECARVLKESGAARVWALCVARSVRD